MLLGALRLNRVGVVLVVLLLTGFGLVSCGGKSNASPSASSGLKFRAFVSQDVTLSSLLSPGLLVIDATKDLRASLISGGLGASFFPGKMFLSSNRGTTLAINSVGTAITIVNNRTETVTSTINLPAPGATESLAISVEGNTAYAAVPNLSIPVGPPGGIEVLTLSGSSAGISGTVPIPSAHNVVESGDGSKLLVFSDNSNDVTIVYPFNIVAGQSSTCPTGGTTPTCQVVHGFDRPVYAFFSSDGTQAWVLNCGPECGGTQASVQVIDLVNGVAGALVPVPGGATVGFVQNQTLYVAGNPAPPNNTCAGITTAAPTCGRLTVVDMPSLSLVPNGTAVITDGYHTNMNMGNGQLFIGSRLCSNVVPRPAPATGEQRGCLTIVNTLVSLATSGAVIFPPDNGDVTGMTPITDRTVFYVVEGGELRIYDTTTDKIYAVASIDVFGQAIDVKQVDF
jgi:hypothetical protein